MSLLELLALERPIIFFDTEATGQNPAEDRIVELGFIQIKPDGSFREWQSFINPGRPIPRGATFGKGGKEGYPGHGITDEMVNGCRTCYDVGHSGVTREIHNGRDHDFVPYPRFADVAPSLLLGFKDCDYGGYNIRSYDLPLLKAEFARNGHQWSYDDACLVDGHRMWQMGEGRSLSDAVERFLHRKHEGAHRALDDVRATLDVVKAQLECFSNLPRSVRAIHDKAYPRDPNALDPKGQIVWRNGEAVMNFGKNWKGMPLTKMTRRNLEWIVSPACGGASDVCKQICREALAGRFPVQPQLKEVAE
jgi:DNA polymerase-3 subunit epsilon